MNRASARWKVVLVAVLAVLAAPLPGAAELSFDPVVIDPSNPSNPHCKTIGDLDGDGDLDAVAASSSGGGMFWYEYPSWTKHTIRASGSWTTDMQVADIDADGDLDVVIPDATALKWYENPGWTEHVIGVAGANNHDVEVGDLEPDGDLDVVTRRKSGGVTYGWLQGATPLIWSQVTISNQNGEGTDLGDLDGDGDLDVALNGLWVEQVTPASWSEHTIDAGFADDVGVRIADIDGNGTPDVVLGPSESSGKLSWYEAIDPKAGPWIEHSIDSSVSFLHTFRTIDVDRDGDLDLVTAEMHQSTNPDEVSVYFNNNCGTSWTQQVVAEGGSHNVRAGDFGGDGDVDIFGANWNDSAPNSAVVEMWENKSAPLALDQWQRHIIETSLPWTSVFVDGRDLNGDGLPDLVAGGWWYPNPGILGGVWTRQTIGTPLNNMAAIHDFDRDGDLDVLGTDGMASGEDLSWAENDGSGGFTIRPITHAATGGDFLQGVSVYQVVAGGQEEVVLSWHNGGSGTALLAVPNDPTSAAWPLTVASATTNQEEVPTGDIDGDGDIDIHLGNTWLRQDAAGAFSVQSGIGLGGGDVPDRVKLADLDGDGDLDVVIGIEFGSALVWGENDGSGGGWTNRAIASDFEYFSVDVGDVDHDGDIDVVGGAHMGSGEVSLYENDGTGTGWTTRVIDSGDSSQIDHHDGTKLVDMDNDGDLDIVSLGWTKRSLVIYENTAIGSGGGGGDTTPPEIASVHALGEATRVVVDFSEPLNAASAGNAANYAISGGIAVAAAVLHDNQHAVTLTTSALAAGTGYTLTVDNVSDLAGNPIAPGSTAGFELGLGAPDPTLVAHWPLDEGAGTVTADASGNGRTGYLTNGAGWGSPTALLDGADDYIDTGTFDVTGSALTLAAWIHADGFSNCSARDCRILSKATGTAEADHYFMLSTIASGSDTRLRFRLKTGGSTTTLIASGGDLLAGAWLHAAAVYDGAGMTLYLNGQPVGTTAKTGALSQNPAVPVWIGGNPTEPSAKPFDGKIDDVRIYERALTQAEIQALPPPSANSIFTDGFESGNLSAWSETRGAAELVSAAARIGTRGARLPVGTSCTALDLVVFPPPPTLSGTHEACLEIQLGAVDIVAPGATLRAGERITVADGFKASADLTLALDPALLPLAWLRDTSPAGESGYTADFHANFDNVSLAPGNRLEHLVGWSDSAGPSFRLVLQPDGGGGLEARLEARLDDGTFAATAAGSEAPIAAGWHQLRVIWKAGAGDGSLTLWVDGAEVAALTSLTNGGRRVDGVDWGVAGGSLVGAGGTLDLDAFSSWP